MGASAVKDPVPYSVVCCPVFGGRIAPDGGVIDGGLIQSATPLTFSARCTLDHLSL